MSGALGRLVAATAGAIASLVVLVAIAASSALGGNVGGTSANTAPERPPTTSMSAEFRRLYQAAAATCPGLPWTVLAAIGTVESNDGTSTLPGVQSGANSAGAEGPMQFEPGTFARYAVPIPPGGANPPSPYDPTDAIYAAARDLCANGARDGVDLPGAIFAYNHDDAYVAHVLALASELGDTTSRAEAAVRYAEAQLGTPYRWGAEEPGVAFDCSGLTQAAWQAAGVAIPRTAEAQWQQLPHVSLTAMQPGDLVFFNLGEFQPGLPGHVGIYIGGADYLDAPATGEVVRIESLIPAGRVVGAARPRFYNGGN